MMIDDDANLPPDFRWVGQHPNRKVETPKRIIIGSAHTRRMEQGSQADFIQSLMLTPVETRTQRLERMLDFIDRHWPEWIAITLLIVTAFSLMLR